MKKALLLICAFMLFMPIYTEAEVEAEGSQMGRDEVFSLLKNAFEAQLSLGEQLRPMSEVEAILSPYFTDSYNKLFLDANLVEENGLYVTYGTDFGQYYIPYYEFSENTKVVVENNKAYVFEFFPENTDGPVGYESHYEGLLLKKSAGMWKVSQYLYNEIPDSIIKQAGEFKVNEEKLPIEKAVWEDEELEVEAASLQFQLGMNPIGGLFQYAAFLGASQTSGSDLNEELAVEQIVLAN
ncbi:DUF3993 domain-containing protein [Bacillus sp. FJAT-27445]|uniref:DUF3993 domain-containing protein n=1 Tax=Bacillus sp. FJAT-27445 TaxID=1679166 RepID=UPI000743C97E|nr:DUF3993 domain-containing protein [Bacillus sp. FJAT-27445]